MKPSIYWLFVFIPVTVILEHAGKLPPPVIFFSAALAIVPIATLIVQATSSMVCGKSIPLTETQACYLRDGF